MKALWIAVLAVSAAHAQADKEAWRPVDAAFAAGEPIPEAAFAADAEKTVYQLMKKVSEGCAQPCQTEKYLKNIALIGKVRKLADVPKIQTVYCPGSPAVCRARKLASAAVVAKGALPPPGGVAGVATRTERAKRAGEAALKTGTAIAGNLEQNKNDDLPGGPEAGDEAADEAPALPEPTAAAGAALDALAALPGAKAKDLAARLAQADKIADPAERDATRRALLTEADRVFSGLLEKGLARELAAAKVKGKPTDAQLAAAREKVFAAAPELARWFVARAERQLRVKDAMAAGKLERGARLEPWEIGASLPPGSTITVDADQEDKKSAPFLGLTFALPDGSRRFEGARPTASGEAETLVVARGAKGEVVRSRSGPRDAEALYYEPGGRLVRSETSAYGGAHVEIKDFNRKGPENELRRYEIRDVKGGKTRVEVRDPDNLRNTVTEYDGSVTVTSRVAKGLPVDPKQPDGSRWTEQKGRMAAGRFQLEQVTLEDRTVLKGSSASGRFLVDAIDEPGGRKLRGETDPKTGRFSPASAIEKDGSGRRKNGPVTAVLGPGGKVLRLTASLRGQASTRANALSIAGVFAKEAGLGEDQAGALGEWLYDKMSRADYAQNGEDGVRDVVLATEKPGKEAALLYVSRKAKVDDSGVIVGDGEDEVSAQSVAQWTAATKFKDEAGGTVLRALDEHGVPQREYVAEGKMRQWFKGYSNDGDAGMFTGSKEYEHSLLVEFTRDPKRPRSWISECGDENDVTVSDPKKPCESRDQAGKPGVIHTTGSGLSDLGSELGDIPGIKQAGKYATKGYYTAVGYLQDDIGFDTSSNPDKRLAVIANKFRGTASKEDTLWDLKADKELLGEVDEKVVERRKKTFHDECVRLGDGCDAYVRSLNCGSAAQRRPCATDEERLDIVRYAYSPAHAIDHASEGGSKFLYVLGGLGQAGEMAAASLPLMGLTEGLGALGKVKYVGAAANLGNAALGGYMTTGWVVGGLANGGEMIEGIKAGDTAQVVKSGVQAAGDLVFLYKGRADAKAKAERVAVAKKIELEKARIEALPDTGFSSLQLDLHKASAADLAKYKSALAELGVPEPAPEHGVAEFLISPRKRAKLEAKLKGSTIESIDMAETATRQENRRPFTADEVDAMFAKERAFDDTVKIDLSNYPPKDYPQLRQKIAEAGGKWSDPVDGVAEVSVPHGKGAELAKALEGTPAKVMSAADQARAVRESAPAEGDVVNARTAGEIDSLWNARNGSNLTAPETVKAQRREAFVNAADPKLRKAVAAAEAAGEIAPASWQGRQGQEANCVPHALANASNGVFKLGETQKAGELAGADYAKNGTSESQLLKMMVTLEADAKARGVDVDYRAVEPREYFRQQAEAAKAGKPRQAAVAVIRTGASGNDPHGLHAVALRGQIVVDGNHYIVVTDSHMNKPLLYTPDGFASAAVSNGVVLIDAARAAAGKP